MCILAEVQIGARGQQVGEAKVRDQGGEATSVCPRVLQ